MTLKFILIKKNIGMRLCLGIMVLASCRGSKYLVDIQTHSQIPSNSIAIPERVTAGSESNFAPNLSPNGAYVIYTSDKSGNKDLWEKSTTGGYARQLTFHSSDDFSPVINNNGDKIAFVSRREDAAGDIHIKSLSSSSFSFSSSSQSEGDLDSIKSSSTEDTNPEWFPDSTKIIFAARKSGDKYPQITVASTDDMIPRPLGDARGDQPSVSPDGTLVIYVKDGGLHLYNLDTEKDYQITEGGYLQDGQPKFSSNGQEIVFIRYADDTNDDGFLNADDRSSVWKINIKHAMDSKNKENYLITPLTTSTFSAYNPQLTNPYLYLTLQTHNGLDIFKLSESGQIAPAFDLLKLKSQRDMAPDIWSKLYVLRLASSHFTNISQKENAVEAALLELELLAKNSRKPEFAWALKKLKNNFSEESSTIQFADLLNLHLDLQPIRYQLGSSNLSPSQEAALNEIEQRLNEIISKPINSKTPQNPIYTGRVPALAKFIKAQIAASRRKFFDAYSIIEDITITHKDQTEICASAELFQASILASTSDIDTALEKVKSVVSKYKNIRSVAKDAGTIAIELTNTIPDDQTETLGRLKESSKGLPILPAMAHLKIANLFASQNKKAVYTNELRQIVDLYPDSPEVTLEAADKLMPLEEAEGRYSNIKKTLHQLFSNMKTDSPEFRNHSKSLLMETMSHHGEFYLRNSDYTSACKEFEKVIAVDSLNVNGHRGLVDCNFKLGNLSNILETYSDKYDESPENATYAYIYGYALTYLIDSQSSPRLKLGAIDDSIKQLELARSINSQILQIHQTLGWLYFQRGYWQDRYYQSGAVLGSLRQKAGMVQSFFGLADPNWLQLSIDSYHTAYFLSKPNSFERVTIALNLGQTYYELKNFQKSLTYYLERIKRLKEIPLRESKTEGILYRRAGRSAFQIDELELAENLQRQSLSHWESLNDDEETSYSIDALALTLRERGKNKEAIKLYERLVESTSRNNQNLNKIGALSNLGYCYYIEKKFDESLNFFNLAQTELDLMNAKEEDSHENESSIKVDLGGQGSAAKGFDLFARRNLILSFKSLIYQKLNRQDLQLESLTKKLDILKAHRDDEIADSGKSERFLAEEISIIQNNIGALKLDLGLQFQANESFKEAELTAKLLRPDDQIYKNKGEIANVINSSRIDLRLAALGLLEKANINQRYTDLKDTAESLKPIYVSGSKEQGQAIVQLMALAASLKKIIDPKNPGTDQLLVDSLQIIKRGDIPDSSKFSTLLAFNGSTKNQVNLTRESFLAPPPKPKASSNPESAQKDKEIGEVTPTQELVSYYDLLEQSKTHLGNKSQLKWKIELINRNFKNSLSNLEESISSGQILSNPVDRRLARSLLEIKINEAIETKNDISLLSSIRTIFRYSLLEILNRGTISTENEKRAEILSFFKSKLELKDLNSFSNVLRLREHILIAHRTLQGTITLIHISKAGNKLVPTVITRIGKAFSTWEEESPRVTKIMNELVNSSVISSKINNGDYIYIIPYSEMINIEWEKLKLNGLNLSDEHVLAFMPSLETLADYVSKGKIQKNWIGLIGTEQEIKKRDANPFQKILHKSQDFEEIKSDGENPFFKSIRNYNIVHLDRPIHLNHSEPSKTALDMSFKKDLNNQDPDPDEENPKNSYKDDLVLNDLLAYPAPQTTGLIFSNIEEPKERFATGEGNDGWPYLSLLALKAGIPSVLVRSTKDANSEPGEAAEKNPYEIWSEFYKNLATASLSESLKGSGINARVFGFFGVRSTEEQEFAANKLQNVNSQADDAYDEGDFLLASELYKETLFYNDKMGKQDTDILDRIVASLFQLREYSAALHYKKIASARLKPSAKGEPGETKDPVDYGNSVIESAVLAVRAKKHKEAESLLNEAETIFKNEEDYAQLGKIAQYRGIDAENQKNYEKTIEWYNLSKELYSKVNKGESTQRLLNIGNIYNSRLSEYAKAIEYYDFAESHFRSDGSKDYIPVLIDKANALIAIGQVEDAVILLERNVIAHLDLQKERDLWVRSTQLLASAYLRSGLLIQAKALNEKTIIESRKIEDPRDKNKAISREIDAIGLKGYILSAMGDYKSGFEEFKNAINIANKYKLKGQLAVLYNNYGFWAREFGAVDESIDFFGLALKYDTELKSKSGIAVDQRNMALSIILKGDYSRAKEFLSLSLKTSESLKLVYNTIYCHFGLGDIALREKQFDEAKIQFELALKIASKNSFKEFIWKSHAGLAQADMEIGNYSNSASQSAKAIAIIESQKAGLKSGSSKSEFQSEKGVQEVYQTYVVALMKLGKISKAWSVAEKSRGRAYLDAFGSKQIRLANAESQHLLQEEQKLRRKLDGAASYHRRLENLKAKPTLITEALSDLKKIIATRRQTIAKMYKLDKQLLELVSANAIGLQEAQKKLPESTGLIEYLLSKKHLIAWIIVGDKIEGKITSIDHNIFSKKVADYRLLMQNYSSPQYLGQELSDMLIMPFAETLKPIKRLLVVPHKDLHFISFASLPLYDKYTIDYFSISYLESSTFLRYLPEKGQKIEPVETRILAFSDPQYPKAGFPKLPFATKEASVLKRYFKNVDIFNGSEATETGLKNAKQYDILHIGSHGVFNENFPEASSILFAADNINDGFLSISEIFGLNIKAKMVTLSACESGMGVISSGDEIIGMNRAFFHTGVTSLVSALWRINDVTSAVTMKRFYRNLSEGQTKDIALSNAQKVVREYFKHPAYWAAFRLVGDWK